MASWEYLLSSLNVTLSFFKLLYNCWEQEHQDIGFVSLPYPLDFPLLFFIPWSQNTVHFILFFSPVVILWLNEGHRGHRIITSFSKCVFNQCTIGKRNLWFEIFKSFLYNSLVYKTVYLLWHPILNAKSWKLSCSFSLYTPIKINLKIIFLKITLKNTIMIKTESQDVRSKGGEAAICGRNAWCFL